MTERTTQYDGIEPGEALADGVHVLPVDLELDERTLTVHPVAVETKRGVLLIDVPGWPSAPAQLETGLDAAGVGWTDVWAVLLTHQDPDHAGGLSDLLDRTGPVAFAHRECAPYVDGRAHPLKMEDDRYPAAPIDVEVTEGDRFHAVAGPVEVVHTPGHAPGHVSLYVAEEKLLISGDALHVPQGELAGPRGPLDEAEAVESIGKLADLAVERTLCYHGGYVEHGTDAIAKIYEEQGE